MAEQEKKRTASAKDLREKPIFIDVPDTDLRLECRRPDPVALMANDALPLPIFGSVIMNLNTKSVAEAVLDDVQAFSRLVDRWVCAAVVKPRVVLTEPEAAEDSDALWVEDIEPDIRLAIFRKTSDRLVSHRVSNAVQEFRERETIRSRPRPDSEAVSMSAEPVTLHHG